jgi:K+-transporting ATPase KdpF subunit
MPSSAPSCEEGLMSDPIIGLIVAVGLGAYLIYTLVRPERF